MFLKIVNDPKNQPVYVHCVGGRHRTGVMTAIYRMTVDKWSLGSGVQRNEAVQVRLGLPSSGVQGLRVRLSGHAGQCGGHGDHGHSGGVEAVRSQTTRALRQP